jgi:hypothetical protein
VDRDTYRQLINQMWLAARALEALQLLHLEIAARRRGSREELQAVTALRRALDEFPKVPEQP